MYIFFAPFLFLPLIEIVGFVTIAPRLGFFMTLLWLGGATMLGFHLLKTGGSGAWKRAQDSDNQFFVLQDAFDSLCTLIAAILLIFPGFISDFIAIPFLIAAFRHWLFGRAKEDPDHFVRKGYRSWAETRSGSTKQSTTIEGEFRRVDDKEHLPRSE